ncbi:YhcN/YlaJ family sporulation lipoprotein [Paenibacillus humicola]|uniref:YhcN/YlaJ family sporulation lipoprotein n=1 Tax=Paenibacillus humicola TaxID=3110540 RepID=UPI00237B86C2|nr:YhcN/YlaJ family sporulation lipoprotein [Paenibacillus humicola]
MYKWFLSALFLSLLTAGCGTVARNETSPSPQNNAGVHVQQSVPREMDVAGPEQVTVHLERLAASIPGVQGAHCVVLGNTAVVGIDVDGKLDRSRVGTLKYAVAEAFRKDPYGVNAVVTADMDLTQRLQEIGADIRRGRPIAGFAEEMADIVGRIVPQLPRNTEQREAEPQTRSGTKIDKQL